ncbi:MAG: asparagine synthase (glutamine-hydrolyzing) [Flavobacteriaceae bacterium]|nr:asparagine synthase (glutamine-hydrolyzing) [Flavobacteriaceae bacterium]
MCGIAGFVGQDNYKIPLQAMLQLQQHRGPDFTGTYFDEDYAALGHNRLSIIDHGQQSNQPFVDNSKRYYLTFNGEIYNYKELKEELKHQYEFKTNSDTEVLLATYIIYGNSCLQKLNGMFAFAIWDSTTKKLFAARDRFGVKPFYYSYNNKTFVFASEIKTIFNSGIERKANAQVWANYFSFGSYGQPNQTFWKNIHQLAGGHYLELVDNKLNIVKWYDFVEAINNQNVISSYQEAKEMYSKLLLEAIKFRFRADVPVGFNLSGGLDSSALLALVNISQNNTEDIEAFTFYTNDEKYDELPWVEQMINSYKNPLNKVLLSSSEVQDSARFISDVQDEPFGGIPTLAYAKIFKQSANKGIKVLLDGQGMDEQLAGYDYYTLNNESTIQGIKNNPFKNNMLSKEFLKESSKPDFETPFDNSIQNLQYRDLFYTKIPRALRFNDRVSMAYSTELREPFLDYKLVEFAFGLPLEYKIKDGKNKRILRDVISKFIPNEVSYAPKRPLQTPQREWLANELKEFVSNHITAIKSGNYKGWFNESEIDYEWKLYLNGDRQSSFHIWQLVNFSLLMG